MTAATVARWLDVKDEHNNEQKYCPQR